MPSESAAELAVADADTGEMPALTSESIDRWATTDRSGLGVVAESVRGETSAGAQIVPRTVTHGGFAAQTDSRGARIRAADRDARRLCGRTERRADGKTVAGELVHEDELVVVGPGA